MATRMEIDVLIEAIARALGNVSRFKLKNDTNEEVIAIEEGRDKLIDYRSQLYSSKNEIWILRSRSLFLKK